MTRNAYDLLKRVTDVVLAAVLLLITAPLQLILGFLVWRKLGKPVLFRQPRPGKDERVFELMKFRTMLEIDEDAGRVTNEQRTHPFGERLRSTSLDELPSLWNVFRGDMSLVGPRPLRTSYLRRYSDDQALRHRVRPGVTGWAQVNGRNSLPWDERLQLDQWYVENRGAWLDVKILLKTVIKAIRRDGIAEEGQATMSEFFGPERTGRLRLVGLSRTHLPDRVAWLKSPEVKAGISLSFEPELGEMTRWLERIKHDQTRADWVAIDAQGTSRVMCGLTRMEGGTAELYIYVSPDSLGQGYGREAMQLLMARARRRGITSLRLQTKRGNERSQRLYRALGFEPIDEGGPMVSMSIGL